MAYKILFATDLHGNEKVYNILIEHVNKDKTIKAVILGGDLCPRGNGTLEQKIETQKKFIDEFLIPRLKEIKTKKFIMMGNDDYKVNEKLLQKSDATVIHNKTNKLGKFSLIGYSFVPQTPFLLKDWEKLDNKEAKPLTDPKQDITTVKREAGTIEDDLKKLKKLSSPKKTIYVFHSPPYATSLDVTSTRLNVGSKSIRKFIEEEQPPLTLHGHIHESLIMGGEFKENIGKTICINPGSEYMDDMLNIVTIDLDNLDDIEHEML